jgi:hypothetical protein
VRAEPIRPGNGISGQSIRRNSRPLCPTGNRTCRCYNGPAEAGTRVAGRESLRGAPAACACPLRPRIPFALARPLPRRCTSSTHSGTPYDSGRPLSGTPFDGSEACNGSLWSGIWRRHFARAGLRAELRAELAPRWAASRLAASRATLVERTPPSSPCRAECRCKQGSGASLDVSPDDALYTSTGECLGIERTECLQIPKRKPQRIFEHCTRAHLVCRGLALQV